MSESAPENGEQSGDVNVEAEQAVVNTAEDGGGVDNAAPESGGEDADSGSEGDSSE